MNMYVSINMPDFSLYFKQHNLLCLIIIMVNSTYFVKILFLIHFFPYLIFLGRNGSEYIYM